MQLMVLTQKQTFQKDEFWWIKMFDMNDIMVKKKINKLNNHLLNVDKNITQFLNYCIYIYIICNEYLYYWQ
jgi:hypothetical protein